METGTLHGLVVVVGGGDVCTRVYGMLMAMALRSTTMSSCYFQSHVDQVRMEHCLQAAQVFYVFLSLA